MRWSYKTVHYELKKEGLLGSAFLDAPEIELSFNEYGRAGWELVSILETMDGIIAVFKQPLSRDSLPLFYGSHAETGHSRMLQEEYPETGEQETELVSRETLIEEGVNVEKERVAPFFDRFESGKAAAVEDEPAEPKSPGSRIDVGSIRIE